ncbi:MAG: T9SS type A sorting domain-containing protein, partial [Bacteroidota bacterium]
TGDTDAVDNVNDASTTVTMPESDITVTATYTDITSVRNAFENNGINIYPNPLRTSDLTIEFGQVYEGIQVVVRDIEGKVVYQEQVSGEKTMIPVNKFSTAGIYIISLFYNEMFVDEVFIVH